ncbi:MAG: hypothetical protein QW346_03310 [Candidatus Micrarchaeaceae archaeon]
MESSVRIVGAGVVGLLLAKLYAFMLKGSKNLYVNQSLFNIYELYISHFYISCLPSAENEVEERETNNLEIAATELKCDNLLLVTWDYEGIIRKNGKAINAVPIWKWLLQ